MNLAGQSRWLFAFSILFTSAVLPSNGSNLFASDGASWWCGFSKVDITPGNPLRLSGYASRNDPHTGVADPLSVRVMVLSPTQDRIADSVVLVSVDSICVTNQLTQQVAAWLQDAHKIPRAQLVLSSTHSHAAPQLAGGLNNLFRVLPDIAQEAATQAYTELVKEHILEATTEAIQHRTSGTLSISQSKAGFAVHRRVIRDGTWTGFGVTDDGPVDHRVRVLSVRDDDDQILGAAYLYACHCTTLGPSFNQVSGDWAGLSASRLEQIHKNAVFLPIIGCGADANPNPRDEYGYAQQHAAELVDAVQAALSDKAATSVTSFPAAHYGHAGLVPEQPTGEMIEQRHKSSNVNEQRWAEHMQQVQREMGRLPESVPMPIHTWQFGDQLTWVFLGGEVVVQYQFRIEKELDTEQTWVAAYCDDVFAYVASEAMRSAGGYEVDFSMIYYLQPGRWETGTEDRIVERVREIFATDHSADTSLSVEDSVDSIHLPPGYRVETLATEPLIVDPINLAFGHDGRVWIVEMHDYPLGNGTTGQIKWLKDTDHDGTLDQATVFLNDLHFPTSVFPWKNGAIVIAAPNILYAMDEDGDGVADETQILVSGIAEANPQHRASGFEIGLDGWLHLGVGHGTRTLFSHVNQTKYDVQGHDVAWNPATGDIRITGGETQFVPGRDAFGRWFGNSNSKPMYQFLVPHKYRQNDRYAGPTEYHLLSPAIAPPVYPSSEQADRFNDLFAQERFTSACSSIIGRVPGIAEASQSAVGSQNSVAFICEPVHNLVARVSLEFDGLTFSGNRHPEDHPFDFFSGEDPWMRPVRAINSPDGSLWIVDMQRRVIEHPEWIPTAWQQQVNLRGGASQGRVYRVFRQDFQPTNWQGIALNIEEEIGQCLKSTNSVVRDFVAFRAIENPSPEIQRAAASVLAETSNPAVIVSALGVLAAGDWLTDQHIAAALRHDDHRVVRYAIELSETFLPHGSLGSTENLLIESLRHCAVKPRSAEVDLQWVLTASLFPNVDWHQEIKLIAARNSTIPEVISAIAGLKQPAIAASALQVVIGAIGDDPTGLRSTQIDAISKLWRRTSVAERAALLEPQLADWQDPKYPLGPTDILLLQLYNRSKKQSATSLQQDQLDVLGERARAALSSDELQVSPDSALIQLVGTGLWSSELDSSLFQQMLHHNDPSVEAMTLRVIRRNLSADTIRQLTAAWPSLRRSTRLAASATLVQHRAGVLSLVGGLEKGSISRADLGQSTIEELRHYRDRIIRARCISVLGQANERSSVVKQYLTAMPNPSATDIGLGKRLFQEHCSACHTATDSQPMVGPALTNLTNWTNQQWIAAIFDPNLNREPRYEQSQVLTKDGNVLNGIIISDNQEVVQIAANDGRVQNLAKANIEVITPKGISLMPEGFEEKLTPESAAALIAFLRSGTELNAPQ